jgi:hypothetical protein
MESETFISIFFYNKIMNDFDAGGNYVRAKTELRENVHAALLKLLENTKGILNRDTGAFAETTMEFLQTLGLKDGDLTYLRAKLTAVQDKERLIWEIKVPLKKHHCGDCTTEKYQDDGCDRCEYKGGARSGRRYFCKLGHTTVVIVREATGGNSFVMKDDHFRTELGRPTG